MLSDASRNYRHYSTCFLLFAAAFAGSHSNAIANSGIPGPIMWSASALTTNPLQWVAATMLMCVGIEGVIYRYAGLFRRPFLVSLIANVISLIIGVPLALLGAIDPTWFVLPTIVSIIFEGLVIRWLPQSLQAVNPATPESRRRIFRAVIWSNILTNLIMASYILYLYHFRNG
jgi:hypothetical protein